MEMSSGTTLNLTLPPDKRQYQWCIILNLALVLCGFVYVNISKLQNPPLIYYKNVQPPPKILISPCSNIFCSLIVGVDDLALLDVGCFNVE